MLVLLYLNQTDLTCFLLLSYLISNVQVCSLQGGLSLVITHSFRLALVPTLFPEKKFNVYTNKQRVPSGVPINFNTP